MIPSTYIVPPSSDTVDHLKSKVEELEDKLDKVRNTPQEGQ